HHLHEGIAERPQSLTRRFVHDLFGTIEQLPDEGALLHHVAEEVAFVLEVVIYEAWRADIGGTRDILIGRLFEALGGEHLKGSVHDLLAALLVFLLVTWRQIGLLS